jgi:FKBP-type peptidyl-prolyl cis-trans isomerase FklB
MKWLLATICGLGLVVGLAYAQEKQEEAAPGQKPAAEKTPELKTLKDRASYSIGLDIGRKMAREGLDLDPDLIARGIKDVVGKKKALLSDEQVEETMIAFQEEATARQAERRAALAEKNREEGRKFLGANAKKPGVKSLPSGLQYEVIEAGTRPMPKATDTVRTHYRGTLLDGTEFDSSHRRGEPAEFTLSRVIKGWTEALQLMRVGAKWRLFIPAELAYGERGAGDDIGPNATLVFEIELISIEE